MRKSKIFKKIGVAILSVLLLIKICIIAIGGALIGVVEFTRDELKNDIQIVRQEWAKASGE
jgi:hypothetical protein